MRAVVITRLSAQASPITEAAGGLPPAAATITTRSALAISATRSSARPATSPSHACIDQAPRGAPSSESEVKKVARRHGPLAMRLTTRSAATSRAITLTVRGCELGASMRKRCSAALVARALSLAMSHRCVGEAFAHGERLARGVLERLVGRQHHRSRAHAMMRGVYAGRDYVFFHQRLDRAQEAMARHDDAVVGRDEVLFGT